MRMGDPVIFRCYNKTNIGLIYSLLSKDAVNIVFIENEERNFYIEYVSQIIKLEDVLSLPIKKINPKPIQKGDIIIGYRRDKIVGGEVWGKYSTNVYFANNLDDLLLKGIYVFVGYWTSIPIETVRLEDLIEGVL